MHIYLIRHAATDTSQATDPYNHPLSVEGQERARQLAPHCEEWGVGLLVTGMMLHSQQTADAVSALLPHLERWDLTDLEEMGLDDLMGDPSASHLVATWTPSQFQTGLARLWIRVMAVLTRIQIYAKARRLESVAIIAGEQVLKLLLLNWLGQDWTSYNELTFEIAPGAVCRVMVGEQETELHWLDHD